MPDVDYEAGENESPSSYPSLDKKTKKAMEVIETGLSEYKKPAILWTGGKDSTLMTFMIKQVCESNEREKPPVLFIDHGDHFDQIREFVERWGERWGFDIKVLRNESALAKSQGGWVDTESLSPTNKEALSELDVASGQVKISLNTTAGTHLLKTVPLNEAIRENDYDAVFSGIRWDEQESRSDETFFSPRREGPPDHDRVHPMLQFDEPAIWDATWFYMVPETIDAFESGQRPVGESELPCSLADIPVNELYFEGYRSIGSKTGTEEGEDDTPAWMQNLDTTDERAGRSPSKDQLVERLRELGYM